MAIAGVAMAPSYAVGMVPHFTMSEQPMATLNAAPGATVQTVMDADAMRFLYDLGSRSRDYTVQNINGATYVNVSRDNPLTHIPTYEKPEPDELSTIYTLSGLMDYIRNDVDAHFPRHDRLQVLVTGVDRVELWSPVHGEKRDRSRLAVCQFERPRIALNEYMQYYIASATGTLYCPTVNKIDLTAYSTIHCRGIATKPTNIRLYVGTTRTISSSNAVALQLIALTANTIGEGALDISTLSGQYYVFVGLYSELGPITLSVDCVWMD